MDLINRYNYFLRYSISPFLIFIIDDGLPEDSISKLRITSTAFKIEEEILLKSVGKSSPLILADVDISGAFNSLIISIICLLGVTLNAISFFAFER